MMQNPATTYIRSSMGMSDQSVKNNLVKSAHKNAHTCRHRHLTQDRICADQ